MPIDLSHTPIRAMEPVIIDRLRLAFPKRDFTIERVPQVLTLNEFKRLASASPFLGLAWTGFRPDGQTNARQTKGDMLWRLMLIFKASNTLETRFKGDKKGIGLDAMIDVAVVLLNGAVFEGIGTAQVTAANSVYAEGWGDEHTVIAQVDFTVKFTATPASLQLVTAEDFERLGITWAIGGAVVETVIEPPPDAD